MPIIKLYFPLFLLYYQGSAAVCKPEWNCQIMYNIKIQLDSKPLPKQTILLFFKWHISRFKFEPNRGCRALYTIYFFLNEATVQPFAFLIIGWLIMSNHRIIHRLMRYPNFKNRQCLLIKSHIFIITKILMCRISYLNLYQ